MSRLSAALGNSPSALDYRWPSAAVSTALMLRFSPSSSVGKTNKTSRCPAPARGAVAPYIREARGSEELACDVSWVSAPLHLPTVFIYQSLLLPPYWAFGEAALESACPSNAIGSG